MKMAKLITMLAGLCIAAASVASITNGAAVADVASAAAGASGAAMIQTASQAVPGSSFGAMLQVALSLLFVLAVMIATAWAIKRYGPKRLLGDTTVRIVGGVSLGGRERVLVIEVADQWIIVGAAPGRVNALGTMPRQQIEISPDAPDAKNFAAWLKQTIDKRNAKQ
jgi:flagellar protein FliO/FliZ